MIFRINIGHQKLFGDQEQKIIKNLIVIVQIHKIIFKIYSIGFRT